MFSGLSKLLDKNFVLGFFLPVLIAVFGFAFANSDIQFFQHWLDEAKTNSKDFGNIALLLGVVWVLAVLLMALNHFAYRLLEGYYWPVKRMSAQRKQREVRRKQRDLIRRYAVEYETAKNELQRIAASAPGSDAVVKAKNAQAECYQRYLKERELSLLRYPSRGDDVLSTRFGNVLRSFELYSTDVYAAEVIHIWPRLLAVVPRGYQTLMADARSTVDFFVSLAVLASFTSTFTFARGAWLFAWGIRISSDRVLHLLIFAAATAVVARVCYEFAISAAGRWGAYVKGTFDLYLPVLAKALGYELPRTPGGQRDFWDQWSSQFRFHERVDATGWKPASTSAEKESKEGERDGDDSENEGEKDEDSGNGAD